MIAPVIILFVTLVASTVALSVPSLSDLILVTGPCVLASLLLILQASLRRGRHGAEKYVVIDGSNVMHWKDGTPQIEALHEVVAHLMAHGFTPGVVFDANVGHLVAGKYQHDGAMGKLLGLQQDNVIVVNKGSPSDPVILATARDLGARIVTNDRYRDWVEAHPEIKEPGHLIRGGYRDGQLWLDLAAE